MTESDQDGFVATQMRKADQDYGWRTYILGKLRISRHMSGHLSMLTGAAVQDLAEMIEAEIVLAGRGA